MTKTQIGITDEKEPNSPNATAIMMPPVNNNFSDRPTTCWYVWGIIATIFCVFPLGIVGLVHAMIAKHEGERGNFAAHRARLYQAKCWISWSIALGCSAILGLTIYGIWFYTYWDYYYWY